MRLYQVLHRTRYYIACASVTCWVLCCFLFSAAFCFLLLLLLLLVLLFVLLLVLLNILLSPMCHRRRCCAAAAAGKKTCIVSRLSRESLASTDNRHVFVLLYTSMYQHIFVSSPVFSKNIVPQFFLVSSGFSRKIVTKNRKHVRNNALFLLRELLAYLVSSTDCHSWMHACRATKDKEAALRRLKEAGQGRNGVRLLPLPSLFFVIFLLLVVVGCCLSFVVGCW